MYGEESFGEGSVHYIEVNIANSKHTHMHMHTHTHTHTHTYTHTHTHTHTRSLTGSPAMRTDFLGTRRDVTANSMGLKLAWMF